MTQLGHEALRRYYRWLLEGPHQSTVLGVFERDRLAGYSFGGIFNGALTGFLRENRTFLALRVVTHPWLIANPLFRNNIRLALRLLVPRRPAASAPARAPEPPAYGILSIAVDPGRQGQGIGQLLMRQNEQVARAAGFARMILSVTPTNAQAVRFYERDGWERELVDGAWSRGVMTKRLA
ncbi:MAG: GNAT family N-acetyltransferase [Deltaproteobacteria bacterium]|nr:GNAT family N-acetyltransferase [Deltaproteobacteria bacterium]MDQ3297516.1 GNAT family N-acetyltransferase [Myxococcota bacterium]